MTTRNTAILHRGRVFQGGGRDEDERGWNHSVEKNVLLLEVGLNCAEECILLLTVVGKLKVLGTWR